MPLAFFCTLFFRHRKKSVSALQDCKSCFRAAVGASDPIKGKFLTAKLLSNATSRGLSARPLHPFGKSACQRGGNLRLRARQRAFLGANNRRGSHCRALRLLFACIPPAPFRKETNFPANGKPFPHTRAAHPHFPIKTGPLSFSESGPCSFSFVSPSARRGRLSRQRRRPTRPQRRCTRRPAWCSAEIHK